MRCGRSAEDVRKMCGRSAEEVRKKGGISARSRDSGAETAAPALKPCRRLPNSVRSPPVKFQSMRNSLTHHIAESCRNFGLAGTLLVLCSCSARALLVLSSCSARAQVLRGSQGGGGACRPQNGAHHLKMQEQFRDDYCSPLFTYLASGTVLGEHRRGAAFGRTSLLGPWRGTCAGLARDLRGTCAGLARSLPGARILSWTSRFGL